MTTSKRIIEWSIPSALLGAFVFGVIGSQDKDLFLVFLSGVMFGIAFMALLVLFLMREFGEVSP